MTIEAASRATSNLIIFSSTGSSYRKYSGDFPLEVGLLIATLRDQMPSIQNHEITLPGNDPNLAITAATMNSSHKIVVVAKASLNS